jgi:uncharacterized protein YndB with AHSA1/START domain
MEKAPLIFERVLNAPVSKVWKALTDTQEMKQWYFDLETFRAEKGFQFQFTGGPDAAHQYLHLCEVTEVIPEKLLTYSWRYEGYTGISFVCFELSEQAGKTLLRLTHRGLESFPGDNPDFAAHNFETGWNEILHVSLKNYVEK